MKKTMLELLGGLACAALIVGCATTQAPVQTGSSEEEAVTVETTTLDGESEAAAAEPVYYLPPVPEKLNAVEYLDDELMCRVIVQKTTYKRTPGGPFEVLASFKNMTDKPIRLQVRTQYFDGARVHQEGPTPWHIVYLPGGGIETYKTYSYRKDLEYYLVEVQEHCD